MPRPQKLRRICSLPEKYVQNSSNGTVTIGMDEFEVIRLIDLEGLDQSQCAIQMNVARPTIAAIYANARHKLAQSAVLGKTLKVSGGAVEICPLANDNCCGKCGLALCGECERDCAKKLADSTLF